MEAQLSVLPKSPLRKAVNYALDNRKELTVYTTDGRIPIDNNAVEGAIRPVALGRKTSCSPAANAEARQPAIFLLFIPPEAMP